MASKEDAIWTKPFISLFFTNISVFTIFYALISTLPLFAINVLSRTDEEAGLLVSIFLLSAIIFRPFTGRILDIVGKRKMLIISLAFYFICTVLYYFIFSFTALLALRFFQGIWFSIATTAAGSLAVDHIPVRRSGAGLGYFTMSTNLAVVIGPMIGLYIIQAFSFESLFILLSILMFCGSLSALLIPTDQVATRERPSFKIKLSDLLEKKALPVAVLASLLAFTYASVLSYLSIYAEQKDLLTFASTFFLVFSVSMILTRPFTGRIFDEKGPAFVLIPAFICYFIGIILLALMGSPFTFLLAGIFFGLGYGGIVPSLQTLAIQSTARDRSGYATATFFTLFDIGIAVGSYVLGIIAITFGYQNMYLITAGLVIFVFLFYLKVSQKNKTREVSLN